MTTFISNKRAGKKRKRESRQELAMETLKLKFPQISSQEARELYASLITLRSRTGRKAHKLPDRECSQFAFLRHLLEAHPPM